MAVERNRRKTLVGIVTSDKMDKTVGYSRRLRKTFPLWQGSKENQEDQGSR